MYAEKLTQDEVLLADRYHRLIFTFLNENKLNESEYYGLAAIGYCKAVKAYCRNHETQKWSFTTIAWRKMKAEVLNEWQKRRRLKRKANIISLDAGTGGEETISLYECIGKPDCNIEEIPVIEVEQEIKGRLDETQRQQLENLLQGYTIRESAKILRISENRAYKNQKVIKEVTKDVLNRRESG